ncbi:hypothetical protein [Burkholderia sp. 9120]|uniref:hypothetical protein n=1 Tax=Burkholderia sp. 9120 TaxID=1500897 RepID=UPI0012E07777|nr:hypothetical protein [Burkholderia sp. 9120]
MNNQVPDFVSLKEVLSSLAGRVTVPVFGRFAELDEPNFIPAFREALYRYSKAAEDLESHISLALPGERPRWLDKRWGMGTARHTEMAENHGLQQLRQWADVFPAWVDGYQGRQWVGREEDVSVRFPDMVFFNMSNLDVAQKVGFDKISVIDFLKRCGISHTLAEEGVVAADGSLKKLGLRTPDMAAAFANLGGWDDQEWAKNLPQAAWAKDARIQPGRRGKNGAAVWDPVRLAQLATPLRDIDLRDWGRRFRESKLLQPWRERWLEYERNEHWYGDINPPHKP